MVLLGQVHAFMNASETDHKHKQGSYAGEECTSIAVYILFLHGVGEEHGVGEDRQ